MLKGMNITVGALETNCYIVFDENATTGVIIDPGDEALTILDVLRTIKIDAEAIILTHTHFDHVGKVAREKAGKLIVERMRALVPEGDAIFLTGDFNANWDNPILGPVRACLSECRETAPVTTDANTFNAWGGKDVPAGTDIIDHIFYRGARAEKYELLDGDYGVPFISDHWPVMGTFKF